MKKSSFLILLLMSIILAIAPVIAADFDNNDVTIAPSDMDAVEVVENDYGFIDEFNDDVDDSDNMNFEKDVKSVALSQNKEINNVKDTNDEKTSTPSMLGASSSSITIDLRVNSDTEGHYCPYVYPILFLSIEDGSGNTIKEGSVDVYLNGELYKTVELGDVQYSKINDRDEFYVMLKVFDADKYELSIFYHDENGKFSDSKASENFEIKKCEESEIRIINPSIDLSVGEEADIGAMLMPYGNTDIFDEEDPLTYSSSDTDVVSVSPSGIVKANNEGTAIITVSFDGNKNYVPAESKTVTVTVHNGTAEFTLENESLDLNDEVPTDSNFTPATGDKLNFTQV